MELFGSLSCPNMKSVWKWIAALSALSLATVFASNILSSFVTFSSDINGQFRAHILLGGTLHALMLAWLLVFVRMCIGHRWKALWALPLVLPLYLAQAKWDVWFCC